MIALAFKRGTGLYSVAIKSLTGSEFSHVELWLDGPVNAALCYSSREPTGTGFATLDLSDPGIWEIVYLPALGNEENLLWYCKGSSGRPYDYIGIAGIGTDLGHLHVGAARFCSNECTRTLQEWAGLWTPGSPKYPSGINPWMVAPGWHRPPDGRFGLHELAKALIA